MYDRGESACNLENPCNGREEDTAGKGESQHSIVQRVQLGRDMTSLLVGFWCKHGSSSVR